MSARRRTSKRNSSAKSNIGVVARPSSATLKKQSGSSHAIYDQLDDSQKRAVELALRLRTALVHGETGTGKTWVTGGVTEALWEPDFLGLIIVPLTNKETTWWKFLHNYFWVCRSIDELILTRKQWGNVPLVLLMHYEEVPAAIKKLRKIKWTLIVYDEIHRLKKRSSLASRRAKMLAPCAEYKLGLTGTPIDEQPMDLWAQFRFVNDQVLDERWEDFQEKFTEETSIDKALKNKKLRKGSFRWKRLMHLRLIKKRPFDWDKLDEFKRLVDPWIITLELKLKTSMTIHEEPVILYGRQRRMYQDMEDGDGIDGITIPNEAVRRQKLHQIVGGWVKNDEEKAVFTGWAKMRALRRIIRKQTPPVVIFCAYWAEIEGILRQLKGKRTGIISGRNRKQRVDVITAFMYGKIDYLICQVKAGGVGLDLFHAHRGILYSWGHSFIDFKQLLGRLHRRGQVHDVDFWLIYAPDTVDMDRIGSVVSKSVSNQRLFSHKKGYARAQD